MRTLTTRNALAAYGVLLVLPTIVFGWLHWSQLVEDYEAQLDAAPQEAEDKTRWFVEKMQERVNALLRTESLRPFSQYGEVYSMGDGGGDDLKLLDSPLVTEEPPEGILAWYSFDNFDNLEGSGAPVEVFNGPDRGPETEALRSEVERVVESFSERKTEEGYVRRATQLAGIHDMRVPLEVAAVAKSHKEHRDCLERCHWRMKDRSVSLTVSDFHLQFYMDAEGTPRALATRRVLMGLPLKLDTEDSECLQKVSYGMGLHQGMLLDVGWLLADLPDQVALEVLEDGERLVRVGAGRPVDAESEVFVDVFPIQELGFDTYNPRESELGRLQVAVNTAVIHERFRRQRNKVAAVAAMLILVMGTGIFLIQRSVRRELEQAQRTQNFVSAVTHELRTPLSAIRLYGEMLLENWTDDPEKQRDYHRRIVRETNRLGTLVERVLEKGRLDAGAAATIDGDLSEVVESIRGELADAHPPGDRRTEGNDDLIFDLELELPRVRLSVEAVAGILCNLVENARKYAPYDPADRRSEPIRVTTRQENGRVLLEVADRGPGIPSADRERIFDAFQRLGNEATRTATGTGLGLHLVRLHAEAIGAEAAVRPRPGGGSVFQVTFKTA